MSWSHSSVARLQRSSRCDRAEALDDATSRRGPKGLDIPVNAVPGVLLINKPPGPTSHDVVAQIRRSPVAAGAKVGHTGTLDPFAAGLLIVLVGRATRFQRYFMALPKRYRARVRFGAVSETGDPEGPVEATGRSVVEDAVRAALPALTGEIDQRAPRASAVKVAGERLYRKARRGEDFEPPVRRVSVHSLELARFDAGDQSAELAIECSSGTYVRRLVTDLGEMTGAGAYCEALERTGIGPFEVGMADPERLLGLAEALSFLPARELSTEEEHAAANGRRLPDPGPDGEVLRLICSGRLVAVSERREGLLHPLTVVG
jgi:tRNA pseudouridine55 synthase